VIPRQSQAQPPLFYLTDDSFQGLFVDPAHKFAFCTIPKNAVTQWTTVLRNVYRNETKYGFTMPAFGIARVSQGKHGIQAIQDIFESPNRTVAVMVRDTLARFASAYLMNKCFDWNCASSYCLPRIERKLSPGEQISFRQALNWILSDTVNVFEIDRHWALQSE
jgi:hypothetical protein